LDHTENYIKTMLSFAQFNEAALTKNTHMVHLEDGLLKSESGNILVAGILEEILEKLKPAGKSTAEVSVKWDGSPAIVFGTDPSNKKFFVGTKAALSKNSKACYSDADVDKYYGDKPALNKLLKASLKYLSKIKKGKGVYQGDLMFADNIKKKKKIDGETNVIFKPNTIVYAVPQSSKALYATLDKAKYGIVIHTVYSGSLTLSNMVSSFNVKMSDFKTNSDVWFDDAFIKDSSAALFSKAEGAELSKLIASLRKTSTAKAIKKLNDLKAIPIIEKFLVRSAIEQKFSYNLKEQLKFMEVWIRSTGETEAMKLKSEAGQQKKRDQYNTVADMTQSDPDLITLVDAQLTVIKAKKIIMDKLNQIGNMSTFIEKGDGFEVTTPEGFCAISAERGVFKIVDRLNFSAVNATSH